MCRRSYCNSVGSSRSESIMLIELIIFPVEQSREIQRVLTRRRMSIGNKTNSNLIESLLHCTAKLLEDGRIWDRSFSVCLFADVDFFAEALTLHELPIFAFLVPLVDILIIFLHFPRAFTCCLNGRTFDSGCSCFVHSQHGHSYHARTNKNTFLKLWSSQMRSNFI